MFCQRLNVGTWKLNELKSKIPPGFMKNTTVVYETAGDSVKVTTDGTDKDGKPMHTHDYPLVGDSTADSRLYHQIDDHRLTLANKKDGKITASGRIVVSADGKSRTLTITATDAAGKTVSSTAVYDKQ
jgi:hypothetical protein